MTGAYVYRRAPIKNRRIEKVTQIQDAKRALGEFTHGMELFGFSKGQFSLIDMLFAALEQTGPARVDIATWTIANVEIKEAYKLLKDEKILRVRFLVDYSFPRRQPGYCADLVERFGLDVIRATKSHAKFLLIRNSEWNIVIRTSMNLNMNRRFENFEITDSVEMADFLEGVIEEVFEAQAPHDLVDQNPQYHKDRFKEFQKEVGELEKSEFGASLEEFLGRA